MPDLQQHWELRFLSRLDPWVLKPLRDHLQNCSELLVQSLNCGRAEAAAEAARKVLHPFAYVIGSSQLLAQGADEAARHFAQLVDEQPAGRSVRTVHFFKATDSTDNVACVVQQCELTVTDGDAKQLSLSLVWKPMTNGEWRLFVFATSQATDEIGFRPVLPV